MAKVADVQNCMMELLSRGAISMRWFKRWEHELAQGGDRAVAAEAAIMKQFRFMREEVVARKKAQVMTSAALLRARKAMDEHPRGKFWGLMSRLVYDPFQHGELRSIDRLHKANNRIMFSEIGDLLGKLHSRKLGFVQDHEGAADVIRELFRLQGMAGGKRAKLDGATEFAAGFKRVMDWAFDELNKSGGFVRHRRDFGFTQFHNPQKIRQVTKELYIRKVRPLIDEGRIYDGDGAVIDPKKIEQYLGNVYDEIIAGDVELRPGELWQRHKASRSMAYKTADAYLEYNKMFGEDNLWHAMLRHVDDVGRDLAVMHEFGPNADAVYATLRMEAAASVEDKTLGKWWGGAAMRKMDATYAAVRGIDRNPVNPQIGNVQAAGEAWLHAAQLGSSVLSAWSDIPTSLTNVRLNGGSMLRFLKLALAEFQPGLTGHERRVHGFGLGVILETWTRTGMLSRFSDLLHVNKAMNGMNEAVMRGTFIQPWTEGIRAAFQKEMLWTLGENTGKSLEQLKLHKEGRKVAALLERSGLADIWDDVRAVPTEEFNGAQFLSLNKLKEANLTHQRKLDIMRKVMMMIDSESDFAVVTPDALVRGVMRNRGPDEIVQGMMGQAGSVVRRGLMTYKSFGFSMMLRWLGRTILAEYNRGGHWIARSMYGLAALQAAMLPVGILSYQAKRKVKGQDFMDWDDPRLLVQGGLQAGGWGLFGDFLQGMGVNRYGGTVWETVAGPWPRFIGATASAALPQSATAFLDHDSLHEANNRKDMDEFIDWAADYTPFASSAWYARYAYDKLVIDAFKRWNDPMHRYEQEQQKARARWAEQEDYWESEE